MSDTDFDDDVFDLFSYSVFVLTTTLLFFLMSFSDLIRLPDEPLLKLLILFSYRCYLAIFLSLSLSLSFLFNSFYLDGLFCYGHKTSIYFNVVVVVFSLQRKQ